MTELAGDATKTRAYDAIEAQDLVLDDIKDEDLEVTEEKDSGSPLKLATIENEDTLQLGDTETTRDDDDIDSLHTNMDDDTKDGFYDEDREAQEDKQKQSKKDKKNKKK